MCTPPTSRENLKNWVTSLASTNLYRKSAKQEDVLTLESRGGTPVGMGSIGKSPRVLIVPIEAQGHWAPVLQLLQQLVTEKINFTICTTPARCSELRSYEARGAFGTLEVEFLEMFISPATVGLVATTVAAMLKDFESFIATGSLDPSRYSCMIGDMFLYFCQDFADEWAIPRYCFITSPSYFGLVMLHGVDLISGGWNPNNPEKKNQFIELPGLEMFKGDDIPRAVNDLQPDAFQKLPGATRRAAGLLINSFKEFDMKSDDSLRHQLHLNSIPGKVPPKVFPIGPLLLLPGLPVPKEKTEVVGKHEGIVWLEKQPRLSVLFICFGSSRAMFNHLMLAVAKALEDTGIPFLWALRLPPQCSKDDFLPHGFEEGTQGRGLVVTSWVPQQEILLHPSVGGFLSHCGWNSILESMLGGVPIAGCPMYAEQGMNARHMISELRTAVEIKGHVGQFEAEEIATAITKLMTGQEGKEVRLNMQNLKGNAYEAVVEGGSSRKHLQEFLVHISQP